MATALRGNTASNSSEVAKVVIESLYDTFVTYLQPEVLLPMLEKSPVFKSHKDEIIEDQSSRETVVRNLLAFVLEDDDTIQHFTKTLEEITHGSDASEQEHIFNGTDDEKLQLIFCLKHMIVADDKNILRKLSRNDVSILLDLLFEKKIITEKSCKEGKEIDDPYACCMKVLRSVKRGRPDWPFNFYTVIRQRRPELIQQPASSMETVPHSSIAPPADTDMHMAELTPYSENLFMSSSSSFSLTTEQEQPGSEKFHLTEWEKNSVPWTILRDSGNVELKSISTNPPEDTHQRQPLCQKRGFSDDEDDDEDDDENADNRDEECPDLHLREYQKELAENALKGRNTIICAPTGSGKTRVATHIIRNHLEEKLGDGEPKRKIAFMARTVPLVMQQCKSLKTYLKKYEVMFLTGDSEYSMKLHMMLEDYDVIVLTPRILENHLKRNCLPHLGIFSMLVFDECHHTRKGEPYNTLMYSYLKTKKNDKEVKLPQIVGLTASISVEKAVQDDEAVEFILKVCGNLDAESISCVVKNEEELRAMVPVPEEKMIRLNERSDDDAVTKIRKLMSKLETRANTHAEAIENSELTTLLKKIPTDKKSQQYGQWAVKLRHIARAVPREEHRETNPSVRCLMTLSDYLVAYNTAIELYDLVQLGDVMDYLGKCFEKYQYEEANQCVPEEKMYFDDYQNLCEVLKIHRDTENPNLSLLSKTLVKHLLNEGKTSCGIIFVRTRALTEAITSWLNKRGANDLKNLKATVFTGTAASVDQGGMTTAEQDEVIRKFRSGEVRLLVATSVGEEGLDIPECNLVIKYNHVGNEVTTVQTRGRSRKEGGKSILLAMDKILQRERINQEKAKMMTRAIKEIHQMKRSKIRKKNRQHQEQIMKEVEILEIVKQQAQDCLKKIPFKMVCCRCRKVVIDSKDIKTIYGAHRVVVDRRILEQTKTVPYSHSKYVDEVKMIGTVYCRGEPLPGTVCKNKLGTMMVHSNVPFFVLGIKHFGFDTESKLGLEYYNQWKKVPYSIDDIGVQDFERYLPQKAGNPHQSDNGDSSSDEDSDDDDDDDNKRNMPSNDKDSTDTVKPVEAPQPESVTQAKEKGESDQNAEHKDDISHPGSITHQKRLFDSDEAKSESGICSGGKTLLLSSSSHDETAVKRARSEKPLYYKAFSSEGVSGGIPQVERTEEEIGQLATQCVDNISVFSKISSNKFPSKANSSVISPPEMSDTDSDDDVSEVSKDNYSEGSPGVVLSGKPSVALDNQRLQEVAYHSRDENVVGRNGGEIASAGQNSANASDNRDVNSQGKASSAADTEPKMLASAPGQMDAGAGQNSANASDNRGVSSQGEDSSADDTEPKMLAGAPGQIDAAQNLNPALVDNNDAGRSLSTSLAFLDLL